VQPDLPPPQARLTVDLNALAANWRALSAIAGHPAGAAIKADGYGLGARAVLGRLAAEGLTDAFVSQWSEAAALGEVPPGVTIHVLHGVMPREAAFAAAHPAQPVLNNPLQCALWREIAPGRACSLMVDTGMNRLGLRPADLAGLDGLAVDILMSHLTCADEPGHPMTARQAATLASLDRPAMRRSLANSAGLFEDAALALDLARPGLALYGGVPHPRAVGRIARVVAVEAEVLQVRNAVAGETVGYGATFTVQHPTRLAILGLGYADGFPRALSNLGHALVDGRRCPVVGRVSMDLVAIDVTYAPPVAPGDWIELGFSLPETAAAAGVSQYELLTGLGHRFERRYTGHAG